VIGRLLLGVAGAAWIVGSLAFRSVLFCMERASESTQTIARNWVIASIPKGSRLVLERYCPQLPNDMFTLFIVDTEGNLAQFKPEDEHASNSQPPRGNIGNLARLQSLDEQAVQYMVLSDIYERYVGEGPEHQGIVATYEQLMHAGSLLYEVNARPGHRSGKHIRIFQFDSRALRSVASGGRE
jgi:hypothetical protein